MSFAKFLTATGVAYRKTAPAVCPCCGVKAPAYRTAGLFFGRRLAPRNDLFCGACLSAARHAALARAVLASAGAGSPGALAAALKKKGLKVFDAGWPPLFRVPGLAGPRYAVSGYGLPAGLRSQKGLRRENLERLSFADNSFDLVITADVLEHVGDLKAALFEIARVLKPGGRHVFTVPVNFSAVRTVPARPGGPHLDGLGGDAPAVRDFGADAQAILSRPLPCSFRRLRERGTYVHVFECVKPV